MERSEVKEVREKEKHKGGRRERSILVSHRQTHHSPLRKQVGRKPSKRSKVMANN